MALPHIFDSQTLCYFLMFLLAKNINKLVENKIG